jgi:hypothetical protein
MRETNSPLLHESDRKPLDGGRCESYARNATWMKSPRIPFSITHVQLAESHVSEVGPGVGALDPIRRRQQRVGAARFLDPQVGWKAGWSSDNRGGEAYRQDRLALEASWTHSLCPESLFE